MFKDRAEVKELFTKGHRKFDAVSGITLYRDRRNSSNIPDFILRDIGDGTVQVFVEICSGKIKDIEGYLED